MSQAPIMPVYPDALLGDTLHLSAEQFGAYLLLLFATWRNNGKALPDDDRKLSRICRCSLPHWRRSLRPVLIEFFNCSDGFLRQKRLEKEWVHVTEKRTTRIAAGSLGGKAKALKTRKSGVAKATGLLTPPSLPPLDSPFLSSPEPYPNPDGREPCNVSQLPRAHTRTREAAQPDSETRLSLSDFKKDQEKEAEPRQPMAEIPEGWLAEAEAARDDAGLGPVNLPLEWLKFAMRNDGEVELRRWLEWSLRAWVSQPPERHANGTRGVAPAPNAVPETPWAQRMRLWNRERWWRSEFGPRPDEPGCYVPPQFLAEAAE